MIAADPAIRLTAWNRAAESLYGWTAAEVLGQRLALVTADPFTPLDDEGS